MAILAGHDGAPPRSRPVAAGLQVAGFSADRSERVKEWNLNRLIVAVAVDYEEARQLLAELS